MYPTLLKFWSIRIDTYSVVWFIALSTAILWAIKRLELYDLDEYESRRVMAVSFFFMLLGAKSFEYINHWSNYLKNSSLFLDINRGGLHEFGAISGAFLSAMVMCFLTRKVSFSKLCDVAAPPAILSIAIGRWGCFLNGCCVGRKTEFFTGVHFPFDKAGVLRHPVQIYYSVAAIVIVLILLWVEKKVLPLQLQNKLQNQKRHCSIVAPLGVILYSLMRLSIVPFRTAKPLTRLVSISLTYKGIAIVLPLMVVWLLQSLRRLKSTKIG